MLAARRDECFNLLFEVLTGRSSSIMALTFKSFFEYMKEEKDGNRSIKKDNSHQMEPSDCICSRPELDSYLSIVSDSEEDRPDLPPFVDSDDSLSTVWNPITGVTDEKHTDPSGFDIYPPSQRATTVESSKQADCENEERAVTSSSDDTLRKAAHVLGTGNVKQDKQQYCYFCDKPQLKLARHLTTVHQNQEAVAKLLAIKETNNDGYLKELRRIKCKGNFVHNVKTLKNGKTDIVVVKRPTKDRKVSEYLPCIHCYGFYVLDELWKHTQNCDMQVEELDVGQSREDNGPKAKLTILQQSRLLLESSVLPENLPTLSESMRALLHSMKNDHLTSVIPNDTLLLRFGETLLKKYGPAKKNDIAQRIRQLVRLLLVCQEKAGTNLHFKDILSGKHFDICLSATYSLCGVETTRDGRTEFAIPSLALRLGHLLKKMAVVKRGYCLRLDDQTGMSEAESFGRLLEAEWTDSVSTNAHNTLRRRKDHEVQVLPFTSDLIKMQTFQISEMRKCIDEIKVNPSHQTWRWLAQLTMARVIIFNKRRRGEVSKLLVDTYAHRPSWKELTNQEVVSSLHPLERQLLNRLDLVQMPGKKNRKVPALITEDMKEAIETLISTRHAAGIPETNPFCFASKSASGYLDSWQAMNTVAQGAGLSHSELLSSTRLRKYNATVSQLFDLNPGELEWLSNHMGHDLNIHKDFYRLHESTIELAKVSRLLLAVDEGKAGKFAGKQLKDIALEDFEEMTPKRKCEQTKTTKEDMSTEDNHPQCRKRQFDAATDGDVDASGDLQQSCGTSTKNRPTEQQQEATMLANKDCLKQQEATMLANKDCLKQQEATMLANKDCLKKHAKKRKKGTNKI